MYKINQILLFSILCFVNFSLFAQQVAEDEIAERPNEPAYISESVYIFMHAGPGRQYRILGSINAGESIGIIQRSDDGKYTEILNQKQRTGWIESKFVTANPPTASRVPVLQTELAQALSEQQLANQRLNVKENEVQTLAEQVLSLSKQVKQLESENNALSLALTATNSKQDGKDWLVKGGVMSLISVLFGYIISVLPRRKKRRSEWA